MVDAKVPGVSESPLLGGIPTHFADTYEPSGPFGAKGMGEAATNPMAAAYGNAICNAIGVRFYELPITPEKILAALKGETCHFEAHQHLRRAIRSFCAPLRNDCSSEDRMNLMTNSHILINRFDYLEPATLAEAVAFLAPMAGAPGYGWGHGSAGPHENGACGPRSRDQHRRYTGARPD